MTRRNKTRAGSEYGATMKPNTLIDKDDTMALTPSEQLRLIYQTGQREDMNELPLENWRDPDGPRRID